MSQIHGNNENFIKYKFYNNKLHDIYSCQDFQHFNKNTI